MDRPERRNPLWAERMLTDTGERWTPHLRTSGLLTHRTLGNVIAMHQRYVRRGQNADPTISSPLVEPVLDPIAALISKCVVRFAGGT